MNHALRRTLAVTLAAAAIGCGRVRDMVEGAIAMQRCIVQRGATASVSVTQDRNKRLLLTLRNSSLDTLPAEAKTAAARQVALCARDNYPVYTSLTEVAVAFARQSSAGPAQLTTSGEPIVFTTRDLGAKPAPTPDSGTAKAPTPQ